MMNKARPSRKSALATVLLGAGALLGSGPARADDTVLLSTQLRPIEAAQAMRNDILAGFPGVTFVTEQPPQLSIHVKAEQQAGKQITSVIGALHGELLPLASSMQPLDDLAKTLADRHINPGMLEGGKLGTQHQLYIPWMQATYIMVTNKAALPYLPAGASLDTLTYDQLAAWGANIQEKTGKRMIGFPAGPTGLMPRFFEGYLYPSFTHGVVTTFRSPEAEAMWTQFRNLWKSVNPNSTNYGFMQEPLLNGEVWIAFDHVARVSDALTKKPNDFVAFPAPAGPKGRGWMPVVAWPGHRQWRALRGRGGQTDRIPDPTRCTNQSGQVRRLLSRGQGRSAVRSRPGVASCRRRHCADERGSGLAGQPVARRIGSAGR